MGILGVIAAVASIITGSASSLTVSPEKLAVRPSTAASIPAGTPGLSLVASPNPVTVGSATTATATLGSPVGAAPYGDVTFSRYASADCTGTAIETTAPTALAGSPPSASTSHTPNAAGTFSWSATYGGNANNDPAGPTCVAVTVSATTTNKDVFVVSISGTTARQTSNNPNWQAIVTVSVEDEDGDPVSGVGVAGVWSPDAEPGNSCTTDSSGACTVNPGQNAFNGTAAQTWTLSSLSTPTGYTYASASNLKSKITCQPPTGTSGVCSEATL